MTTDQCEHKFRDIAGNCTSCGDTLTIPAHRPTEFNDEVATKVIGLAEKGKTEAQIAQIIGIHPNTIYNWKKKNKEFLWAVNQAKQVADTLVEAALFQRAIGYSHPETKFFQHEGIILTKETTRHYPPDTQAATMWLKNRQPEKWRDAMAIDINDQRTQMMQQLAKLTPEQRQQRLEELEEQNARYLEATKDIPKDEPTE